LRMRATGCCATGSPRCSRVALARWSIRWDITGPEAAVDACETSPTWSRGSAKRANDIRRVCPHGWARSWGWRCRGWAGSRGARARAGAAVERGNRGLTSIWAP
jgi:hypothetical protein